MTWEQGLRVTSLRSRLPTIAWPIHINYAYSGLVSNQHLESSQTNKQNPSTLNPLAEKPFNHFSLHLGQKYLNRVMGSAQPAPFPLQPHFTSPCSLLLYPIRASSPSFILCPCHAPSCHRAIAHSALSARRTHSRRVYYNYALSFLFFRIRNQILFLQSLDPLKSF